MKKFYAVILLLSSLNGFSQKSDCPVSPDAVQVILPDGSTLTLIGKGTEMISFCETEDGYTILKDPQGFYQYATKDEASGELLLSGVRAHNVNARGVAELKFLAGQAEKNVRPSALILAAVKQEYLSKVNQTSFNKTAPPPGFPSVGKPNFLMILVRYPDLKEKNTRGDFDRMMNEAKYNGTGSFHDYFEEVSYGKMDIHTDVTQWFTATDSFKYYSRNNPAYIAHVRELIAQCIDSAEAAGVDFSKYDNDGDGTVDGIAVVHAGPGAEEGSQLDYIWSHRFSLGGDTRFYDGVEISDYMIMPERRAAGMVGIGVFVHEFGHILGLPDLYDTDGKSEGIGEWGVMGSCGWLNKEKTPCHMDPWCKSKLGWLTPVEIVAPGVYSMNPVTSDSIVYKISFDDLPNEYFLIECRQKEKFDSALKGTGLALWRVNTEKLDRFPFFNDVNTDTADLGLRIIQADGKRDIERKKNRSDSADLFPGATGNTLVNDHTWPSAKLNGGVSSGIELSEISDANNVVKFRFGAKPTANFELQLSGVCAPVSFSALNKSRYGAKYKWLVDDVEVDSGANLSSHADSGALKKITLKVYNSSDSLLATSSKSVQFFNSTVADFDVSNTGLDAVFTNNSKFATSYFWSFGLGQGSSIAFAPTYKYSKSGTYDIRLVTLNAGACNDTMIKRREIYALGVARDKVNLVSVYPTPGSGWLNISFPATKVQTAVVVITDMLGREISRSTVNCIAGENNFLIDLKTANVVHGKYNLTIQLDSEVLQAGIIVE